MLALAQGEFIRAAEMDDIAHIEIGQRPIALNPETWKVRCLPPADIAVQQITRRGENFAVGIVAENAQAFTEAVLVVDQSRVVRAVAFRSGIARTLVEIRKRNIIRGLQAHRQDLTDLVRTRKDLQVACL